MGWVHVFLFRGTGIFVIPSIPLLHKENLPQIGKNVNTEKRNLYDSIPVSLNIRCAGKSCEKQDRFLQFNVLDSVIMYFSWFQFRMILCYILFNIATILKNIMNNTLRYSVNCKLFRILALLRTYENFAFCNSMQREFKSLWLLYKNETYISNHERGVLQKINLGSSMLYKLRRFLTQGKAK